MSNFLIVPIWWWFDRNCFFNILDRCFYSHITLFSSIFVSCYKCYLMFLQNPIWQEACQFVQIKCGGADLPVTYFLFYHGIVMVIFRFLIITLYSSAQSLKVEEIMIRPFQRKKKDLQTSWLNAIFLSFLF